MSVDALQPGEEIYRTLYEDNPSMYFVVGAEGQILSVNRFGANSLGYEVEELLGGAVTDVFHPQDRQEVQSQLEICCRHQGQVFEWQLRKKHRDGHTLWVREQARAVEDSSGRILVLIVCEDVTGQRQVEKALRRAHDELEQRVSERTEALHRSRERYRRLVESVDVIPWESHAEVGGHTYVGPQAEAALGFPREHWYQDGFWAARVVDEDRQRAMEFYDRAARTGKGGDIEYRMIAADGSVVWLRDVVNVATEESGTTVLRGFLIDITKRKEAEALLESQRAFLRQVIDVDPNFIFSKDRDGRFTLVNQAVAEAYGTTVEDLTGKKDEDFNPHPEEVQAFRERDLEVMDSLTEIFVPEEKLTDADGNTRWLQTVKRPIVDADGIARQVLGSATDITTRKLAEARLRDSEAALRQSQQRLRDLAGKLLNAQEEERRRLAREIHDDLSQRLAGLASKSGSLELALARGESLAAEAVAEIHSALVQLATDVRSLSRGLHPSMLEHLGLEDALRWECQTFTRRGVVSVDFTSRAVPEAIPVELGLCFYRVTQAALRNVELHAGTDRARVVLSGSEERLELSIEDEGSGFELARVQDGQGIGLASMEERVRLVQGQMHIESTPGRGTRVVVSAPLALGERQGVESTVEEGR